MSTVNNKGGRLSSLPDRLKEERERLRLSQTEFAAIAASSKASQINYEAGKRSPDAVYLAKIAAAGVDLLYLFSGIRSDHPILAMAQRVRARIPQISLDAAEYAASLPAQISPDDFVYDSRYDVNLSAGPGLIPVENDQGDQLAFSREWMQRQGLNNARCGLLRVRGDSMSPTVPDGALVLLQMSEEPIRREGIYAFSRASEAFIKRLIPVNTGRDGRASSLVILSDNPAYPPDVVVGDAMNDLRVVGRVRCAMTTF